MEKRYHDCGHKESFLLGTMMSLTDHIILSRTRSDHKNLLMLLQMELAYEVHPLVFFSLGDHIVREQLHFNLPLCGGLVLGYKTSKSYVAVDTLPIHIDLSQANCALTIANVADELAIFQQTFPSYTVLGLYLACESMTRQSLLSDHATNITHLIEQLRTVTHVPHLCTLAEDNLFITVLPAVLPASLVELAAHSFAVVSDTAEVASLPHIASQLAETDETPAARALTQVVESATELRRRVTAMERRGALPAGTSAQPLLPLLESDASDATSMDDDMGSDAAAFSDAYAQLERVSAWAGAPVAATGSGERVPAAMESLAALAKAMARCANALDLNKLVARRRDAVVPLLMLWAKRRKQKESAQFLSGFGLGRDALMGASSGMLDMGLRGMSRHASKGPGGV